MHSNVFHDSGCFPRQYLSYWDLQNYRSQWLSVHNVGTVNDKLQKPDINLALLGLSTSEVVWRAGEEVNCRQCKMQIRMMIIMFRHVYQVTFDSVQV